jgi:hypothetical protein
MSEIATTDRITENSSAHVRFPEHPKGTGKASPWLQFIWAMNDVEADTCGKPVLSEWWAGGEAEDYPNVRVIHRTDRTVSIVSKTAEGARIIRAAAKAEGIYVPEA